MTYYTRMGLLRSALLVLAGILFLSCEKLVLDPNGTTPVPNDSGPAVATLAIGNDLQTNPGPYSVLLFPENAVDAMGTPQLAVGPVPEKKSLVFTIPPGNYKLALEDDRGQVFQLTEELGSVVWSVYEALEGKKYLLAFWTDSEQGANNILWVTDLRRLP